MQACIIFLAAIVKCEAFLVEFVKVVLISMIAILIMPAKLVSSGLL